MSPPPALKSGMVVRAAAAWPSPTGVGRCIDRSLLAVGAVAGHWVSRVGGHTGAVGQRTSRGRVCHEAHIHARSICQTTQGPTNRPSRASSAASHICLRRKKFVIVYPSLVIFVKFVAFCKWPDASLVFLAAVFSLSISK